MRFSVVQRTEIDIRILPVSSDRDLTGLEVDGSGHRLVDAADIHCQLPVDEDPHVVVAGKLKYNIVSVLIDRRPLRPRQAEIHAHGQAEVMVQILIPVNVQVVAGIPLVEGEEADGLAVIVASHGGCIAVGPLVVRSGIDLKLLRIRVQPGVVLVAVVVVITQIVFLEEAVNVGICLLVCPIRRFK